MMLNFGNDKITNNTSSVTVSNHDTDKTVNVSSQTASTGNNAIEVLKNMLAGDTFSGQISELNGNEVILKLDNGMNLTATLLENSNFSIGQNITFLINSNSNNKISIKPMMFSEQELLIINRALEASNLPSSYKNVQLVKELLKQNMSIDMNTLNNLSKTINKFQDANIDTIVRLNKLQIPITSENIKQFEAYKSYEHSISNELNNLSQSFGDLLSSNATSNGVESASNLSQKLIDVLYRNNSNSNGENTSPNESDIKNSINSTTINANINSDTNNNINDLSKGQVSYNNPESIKNFISVESRQSLAQSLRELFGDSASNLIGDLKSGDVSAKDLLEKINQLIKDNPGKNSENFSKLFGSKEFSEVINMIIRDKMRISPSDVKNTDGIKDFYNRVHEDLNRISELLNQNEKDSSFSKSLDGLKNNIEFMNDLNKNMSYFQMPIKFSNSDANGELYVFTNKKSLANKSETTSCLLHLDMENLGAVDVFIKLTGKNVSTNFCLESESMLGFVNENIDQLNSRLESLGYNMVFEMTVKKEEDDGVDFVKDFIDNNQSMPNQFIFDTKA